MQRKADFVVNSGAIDHKSQRRDAPSGGMRAAQRVLQTFPSGTPAEPAAHAEPTTKPNLEHAEIYIERLDKWVEVRSRYLDWVDGRLAQMVIATDITARKHTEELAARQAEQVQNVSRLITMGEMASSVAHELNQPLAAISNYTNGMIARIENRSISLENLLPPLEKTAHQAVRAGQVILRIREFVKRSAPKREHCHATRIVTEAVEIASIELRRRDTRLDIHLGDNLPPLLADAILIEQVLINLLKNAAEAMSTAQTRQQQRQITLTASAHEHGIEFAIADHGPGIAEDQIAHLFDAFYSTKSDGLGIGLNLCRSIVESHQGKIRVRNLYNDGVLTGCEFSFWLPASSEGAGSAPATP
ncbi:His Kinase A (phospho-acceptor) domain-containing protein [Lampropedia hyalina DSM 16112]|uniref:histidine kinase n=2 Tax=Lampropedia TaxID=198705 RepID=A0A1M4XDS3_9BURK|nr:His Kinase A (phospho-acceptor) domain-containing protein [Lampropedia hyalina DSM 16112]